MDIYASAHKHGISDIDIEHAVNQSVVTGDQEDGKVLYLGPDRAGNLWRLCRVRRDDGTEIGIHAMRMRKMYESFLIGEADG